MVARTAKIFTTGRSQAVRLPMDFRFEGSEVFIRRDPKTGDVILSRRPTTWDGLFDLPTQLEAADHFMSEADRTVLPQDRDPFEGWSE